MIMRFEQFFFDNFFSAETYNESMFQVHIPANTTEGRQCLFALVPTTNRHHK